MRQAANKALSRADNRIGLLLFAHPTKVLRDSMTAEQLQAADLHKMWGWLKISKDSYSLRSAIACSEFNLPPLGVNTPS
jgi:hypothetical protein